MYSLLHSEYHFSNLQLNRWSNALGLFCHIPSKRGQYNWDRRMRWNCASNAIGFEITRSRRWFKIFGSPDWTLFLSTLLSDGDFRLLPWKPVWDLGTLVKPCLKVTRNWQNLFWNFGSRKYYMFDLPCLWLWMHQLDWDRRMRFPRFIL